MCVIITIEDGRIPSLDTLKDAESWNKDGAGIAWLKNGQVYFKKGLDLKSEEIHQILRKEKPKKAIIHFRIKSSGELVSELNHPFVISPESKTDLKGTANAVLFHNGTIHDADDHFKQCLFSGTLQMPDGYLSDSRIMAIMVSKFGPNFLNLYQHQKFAILDKSGIRKFGDWVKVKHNMCSNDNFIKKETETHLKAPWGTWCNKCYKYECDCKPVLPSAATDTHAEIEKWRQKYRDTKDPKEAAMILDKLDELESDDAANKIMEFYAQQDYGKYWPI